MPDIPDDDASSLVRRSDSIIADKLEEGEKVIDSLEDRVFLTDRRVLLHGHPRTIIGVLERLIYGELDGELELARIVRIRSGSERPFLYMVLTAISITLAIISWVTSLTALIGQGILVGLFFQCAGLIFLYLWIRGGLVLLIEGRKTRLKARDLAVDPADFIEQVEERKKRR